MKRNCVVVSPPIYQGQCIAEGFRECGWEARLVTFCGKPSMTRLNPISWLRKPEPGRDITKQFDFVLREQVLPLAEKCKADLLLVVRPDRFSDQTEAALSAYKRFIATWAMDSLSRYPAQDSLAPYAAASFFLDGGDVKGQKTYWLPLGVDGKLIEKCSAEKDTDVLFIGSLEGSMYMKRRSCLMELMDSGISERYRCAAVVRDGGRIRDEMLKWRARFPISRSVSMEEYARRISKVRVCINVLQNDGIAPINDAFMLIPAAQTCQLVDKRDYLAQWLKPEQHFSWFEEGKLLPRLEELLCDDGKSNKIANEGRKEALAAHTYRERAKQIISRIGIE